MFLGDHWIGTEPFMPEFKTIGLDAVVGSVGNGSTLRLISDIPGVKYTEGRFLPYFSPTPSTRGATRCGRPRRTGSPPGGPSCANPSTHRLRRLPEAGPPVPRLHRLCGERLQRVPGAVRQHQGHHSLLRQAGGGAQLLGQDPLLGLPYGPPRPVPEAELQLRRRHRGAERRPFDVQFLSFEDVKNDPHVLDDIDVLIDVGDADTAHTGGRAISEWRSPPPSGASSGTAAA